MLILVNSNKESTRNRYNNIKMLKVLPMMLTYTFNVIIKLGCCPKCPKISDIILIPKSGKQLTEVFSYRSISPLAYISKLYERLMLERIQPVSNVMLDHQFVRKKKENVVLQHFWTCAKHLTRFGMNAFYTKVNNHCQLFYTTFSKSYILVLTIQM